MTKGDHTKGDIDLLTELMEVIISDILKIYFKDGLPQLRSSPLKELRILAILPLRWELVILNILNSKKQNLDELRIIAIEIQALKYIKTIILDYKEKEKSQETDEARAKQKLAIILSLALYMQSPQTSAAKPSTENSNNKSSRPTLRLSNTPLPIREESSVLSLNFSDLQTLMKRKEKQYQADLQIADAKRVHGFLSEMQAQQRQQGKAAIINNRRRIKQATEQYNNEALVRCQAEWKATLENTLNQLQKVGQLADQQHEEELQRAHKKIEDAKNGKGLQNAKFSKTVLEMEDQLNKLVKAQRYEEAQLVNRRLEQRKSQEARQLLRESVERERRALQQLKKRQNIEKQTLTSRLAQVYEIQQERRANSIDKLVKNIRTYEIDPNKLTFSVQRKLRSHQPRNRTHSVSAFETPSANKDKIMQAETDRVQQP